MDDFFAAMTSDGDYWQEPDFLLSTLVSIMANRVGTQMGVTLLVKGSIMTGTLVGEREYLHGISAMLKGMAKDSIVVPNSQELDMIDELLDFEQWTEESYSGSEAPASGDEQDEEIDDDDGPTPIRHLHLKDPIIIYPNSALSFLESPLPILRLKLNMIDGWMPGRMSLIAPEDLPDDFPSGGIRH